MNSTAEKNTGRAECLKYLKRNYIVSISDGALYALAMGMVPLTTVLVYFISDFVTQKWILGLMPFLNNLLLTTPQILVSKKLERLRRSKPFLLLMALNLRFFWLLMGLNVIMFADSNPILFTVLFYLIYSFIGLSGAFASITWLNFIVKIIPTEYRGKFFGIRSTVGGIFESFGAILMGVIIRMFPYPFNYGVLFLAVFVLTMLSLFILSFSKEYESVIEPMEEKNTAYFKKVGYVLSNDKNFTNYLITVALIGALGKMAFAFQIIFAKEKLGITIEQVSYSTFVLLSCQTLGYLTWGILGDKYGFKRTLELSVLIFLPSILFTYIMSSIWMFYLSIGLFGLAQSARNVNENNLAINLCRDEGNQPLYIGVRNLVMGPFFALSPVLAGLVYDFLGYNVLFSSSAVFMFAGLYIMLLHVREYR